jgi:hypothetical protein
MIFHLSGISQAHRPLSKNNLMAEFRLHYGFLASHHLELDVFKSHYPAFEFSIQKATWGKQQWEAIYGYPLIGISAWYSPLGGFKEIGSAFAIFPFINFPLVQDEVQSMNFRLGLGLAYLTKYYHPTQNYKNFAIGSNINIAGSLYLEYRRKISSMITLSAGLGLTHFSNGAIKTPNYGLNVVTANIGITSYLTRPNPQLSKKMLPEVYKFEFDGKKSIDIDFGFSMGLKNMSQQYGERFMVYALYSNVFKQISWKSKFGLGVDLTYDASDRFLLERKDETIQSTASLLKPGVNVAYQLVISRLSFVFNFGLYLAGAERSEGDVYQRLTLRYLFMKNFFANMALNANWGKAEYIGFGIGYQLNVIYKRTVKH